MDFFTLMLLNQLMGGIGTNSFYGNNPFGNAQGYGAYGRSNIGGSSMFAPGGGANPFGNQYQYPQVGGFPNGAFGQAFNPSFGYSPYQFDPLTFWLINAFSGYQPDQYAQPVPGQQQLPGRSTPPLPTGRSLGTRQVAANVPQLTPVPSQPVDIPAPRPLLTRSPYQPDFGPISPDINRLPVVDRDMSDRMRLLGIGRNLPNQA